MRISTLFLGFTALVLAAVLTLLWQVLGPRATVQERQAAAPSVVAPPQAAPPKAAPPQAAPRPAEPEASGVRTVYPGARPSAARPQQPLVFDPHEARVEPETRTAPAPAERSAAIAPPPAEPQAAAPSEDTAAPPGSMEGTDLNTASVEQLNALGAGMIGRTIVANRPYASTEDLVSRRVLTRRDYETIRPHVVVR